MILYKHNRLEEMWIKPREEIAHEFMASKFNDISGKSLDRALLAFISVELKSVVELDDPHNAKEWEELRRDILMRMYVH